MWALVIFTIATTGASASTVTSLQFATQHLCLIAERQLESRSRWLRKALSGMRSLGHAFRFGEESKEESNEESKKK